MVELGFETDFSQRFLDGFAIFICSFSFLQAIIFKLLMIEDYRKFLTLTDVIEWTIFLRDRGTQRASFKLATEY